MITREKLIEELKEVLNVFLNTSETEISFNQIPWGLLEEVLSEFGYEQDPNGDFETNGWQIDFWVDYIKNEIVLNISGSLWYGEIKIIKNGK